MSANIPEHLRYTPLAEQEELIYQGKVRNTFQLCRDTIWSGRTDLLLVEATDRISIFDFVLPALVPRKGEVLTALTHFWLNSILTGIPNHLEMSDREPPLNAVVDLRHLIPKLPLERCLVVRRVNIHPYEMIFRHHIGGSVYRQYVETGTAAGHSLPPYLPKWSKLARPIFTPSTKAEKGHDVNISRLDYLRATGTAGGVTVNMLRMAYERAYSFAEQRGIVILDTKFEVSVDPFVIADEVLTPDSSRFTTVEDAQAAVAESRDPIFYDKQVVRDWGMTLATPFGVTGINQLDPANPAHVSFVHSLTVPEEILEQASQRYLYIAKLTGQTLEDYQGFAMGIE